MKPAYPYPRIGVGVIIFNEQGQILLGLRCNSHGDGQWSPPGGHLEFGETIFETAKRETKEETGLDVDECKLISVADEMSHIATHNKHYVNIGVVATYKGGEPQILEPQSCREWRWFDLDKLPENRFEALDLILSSIQANTIYQAPSKKAGLTS